MSADEVCAEVPSLVQRVLAHWGISAENPPWGRAARMWDWLPRVPERHVSPWRVDV